MEAVEGISVFCKLREKDCDELYLIAKDNTLPPPPADFAGERSKQVKEPYCISRRDVLRLLPTTRCSGVYGETYRFKELCDLGDDVEFAKLMLEMSAPVRNCVFQPFSYLWEYDSPIKLGIGVAVVSLK